MARRRNRKRGGFRQQPAHQTPMAAHGRREDDEVAHVAEGEVILPANVRTPGFMDQVEAHFERMGVPLERYTVQDTDQDQHAARFFRGRGLAPKGVVSVNPQTGRPEFMGVGEATGHGSPGSGTAGGEGAPGGPGSPGGDRGGKGGGDRGRNDLGHPAHGTPEGRRDDANSISGRSNRSDRDFAGVAGNLGGNVTTAAATLGHMGAHDASTTSDLGPPDTMQEYAEDALTAMRRGTRMSPATERAGVMSFADMAFGLGPIGPVSTRVARSAAQAIGRGLQSLGIEGTAPTEAPPSKAPGSDRGGEAAVVTPANLVFEHGAHAYTAPPYYGYKGVGEGGYRAAGDMLARPSDYAGNYGGAGGTWNPETGQQEFYAMPQRKRGGLMPSRNPQTGAQEFYGEYTNLDNDTVEFVLRGTGGMTGKAGGGNYASQWGNLSQSRKDAVNDRLSAINERKGRQNSGGSNSAANMKPGRGFRTLNKDAHPKAIDATNLAGPADYWARKAGKSGVDFSGNELKRFTASKLLGHGSLIEGPLTRENLLAAAAGKDSYADYQDYVNKYKSPRTGRAPGQAFYENKVEKFLTRQPWSKVNKWRHRVGIMGNRGSDLYQAVKAYSGEGDGSTRPTQEIVYQPDGTMTDSQGNVITPQGNPQGATDWGDNVDLNQGLASQFPGVYGGIDTWGNGAAVDAYLNAPENKQSQIDAYVESNYPDYGGDNSGGGQDHVGPAPQPRTTPRPSTLNDPATTMWPGYEHVTEADVRDVWRDLGYDGGWGTGRAAGAWGDLSSSQRADFRERLDSIEANRSLEEAAPDFAGPTTPGTPNVDYNEDVSSRLDELLAQNSQYMERARTQGLQSANRRGLLNSSMAVGAAQQAALDSALPIASQEADIAARRNLSDQEYRQQSAVLGQEITGRAGLQGMQDDAAMDRLLQELLTERYLQNQELDTRLDIANLDADTRRDLANLDADTRTRIAEMEVDQANQREALEAALQIGRTYQNAFNALQQNPNIPADVRGDYLEHIGQIRDDNFDLLEQLYNTDLDWSSVGTPAPANDGAAA